MLDERRSIIGVEPLRQGSRRELRPDEVLEKLRFLVQSISNASYDYIAATTGKALWLLRLAQLPSGTWSRLIFADKLEYVAQGELSGSKVLVFQDSIRTGTTLASLIKDVEKHGPAKVDTAALLVHHSCQPELIPRWHVPDLLGLLDEEYELTKQDLQELVRSRVVPLEADRVIFKLVYEGEILPVLSDLPIQVGQLVYLTEAGSATNGVTFLDLLGPVDAEKVVVPSWLGEESEERIRVYVMQNQGVAYFAPLMIRYTPTALRLPGVDCVGSERWSAPFCALRQDCPGLWSPSRCSDCSMLNMSLELGCSFLQRLLPGVVTRGITIKQLCYNDAEIKACYHAIHRELADSIDRRCQDVIGVIKGPQIG